MRSTEGGWKVDCTVIEVIPPAPKGEDKPSPEPAVQTLLRCPEASLGKTTIPTNRCLAGAAIPNPVRVHLKEAGEFKSEDFIVQRNRWEKREPPF